MSPPEFDRFVERAVPRRAARLVARGVWSPTEALAASRAAYARALPDGLATSDQHFCHIVAVPGAPPVGEVWYSTRFEGGRVQFWVEWIWIEPEHRRRGYATAALYRLEAEARRRGATRCGLDVWMDNPGAVALYRKLGYATTKASMVKELAPEGPAP